MSWTRLDDDWTDNPILADLSHETRWHYLCMIQFCSRTQRFDGYVRAVDARRCSDVSDPAGAVKALADVGLIRPVDGGYVLHRMEEDHAPPPWVRNRTESNKKAQRRKRAHDAGDHSFCLPANCDLAPADTDSQADSVADSHADTSADSSTEQNSPGQKAFKAEPEIKLQPEPAPACAYPTDPEGLGVREKIEANGIRSVEDLVKFQQMSTAQAEKIWAQAFPPPAGEVA